MRLGTHNGDGQYALVKRVPSLASRSRPKPNPDAPCTAPAASRTMEIMSSWMQVMGMGAVLGLRC